MLKPQVNEWLKHPVTELMISLLKNHRQTVVESGIIHSNLIFGTEGDIRKIANELGQVQLIDALLDFNSFFDASDPDTQELFSKLKGR